MSRTFRRPQAESIVAKHDYNHIAGVYTQRDHVYMPDHGHSFLAVYREPTKRERFKIWQALHTDKGHYKFQGMRAWERQTEQKRHRAKHNRLIGKFLKGINEDVVVEKRGRNPSQYW